MAHKHLPKLFRRVRQTKGIKLAQLARMVGYRNIAKGANRITRFEERGEVSHELLDKLTLALDVNAQDFDDAIEQDLTQRMNERAAQAAVMRRLRRSYPPARHSVYRVVCPEDE